MKAIWKGTLSFGLVNIPIEIYSATQTHSLGFNLLHEKCQTPINYQRFCPTCNRVVKWEEIVKGIKLSDGTYFIITPENLKKLKPEKSDTIDIIEFIDAESLAPIYLDQHYYVTPAKENDKAYFLFFEVLKKNNKVAIGRFVLKDKEYICAIHPYKNGFLLTTLNYQYEIREFKKFDDLKILKQDPKELKLAEQLINKLSKKSLKMEQFKDTFATELKEKIKKKEGIVRPKKIEKKVEIPSLIKALQESLESVKGETLTKH